MILKIKKRMKYIRNQLVRLLDFETITKVENTLTRLSITETPDLVIDSKSEKSELIVSLTTFSKRIHSVHWVLETIARQTIRPNRVILWLDEDEYKHEDLPLSLLKFVSKGLDIRFCENIRSYKKLIPTIKLFPEARIITIDDDILYPSDMIEQLVLENKKFPNVIIGHRAHRIILDKKARIKSYLSWELETLSKKVGFDIFITSGAGTIFPAQCFSKEALDSIAFLKLCPNADDVWFKAMSILNEVKCKKVDDDRKYSLRFLTLPDDQDIGLYNVNIYRSGNDEQIKKVFNLYDITL